MSDDATSDPLLSGALLAGAGVAGYFGARWLLGQHAPAPSSTPATAATAPPWPPAWPSLPAAPVAPPTPPAATPSGAAPPAPRPGPRPPRPASDPVSSPDLVDADAAPVSSPTQVGSTTTVAPSSVALPRRFDPVFERHRGDIPLEYLRALAMRESGMNPSSHEGPARGLLQIIEVVRTDFNQRHRTRYTRAQLLDPDINVRIATWLLRFIVDGYRRNHACVRNLRSDWDNPRFVALVTFGWTAGASEKGGVGLVAGYLKKKGAREIDLDLIHEHARAAGASKHLSNPAKVRWSRSVVALYQRERALSSSPTTAPVA